MKANPEQFLVELLSHEDAGHLEYTLAVVAKTFALTFNDWFKMDNSAVTELFEKFDELSKDLSLPLKEEQEIVSLLLTRISGGGLGESEESGVPLLDAVGGQVQPIVFFKILQNALDDGLPEDLAAVPICTVGVINFQEPVPQSQPDRAIEILLLFYHCLRLLISLKMVSRGNPFAEQNYRSSSIVELTSKKQEKQAQEEREILEEIFKIKNQKELEIFLDKLSPERLAVVLPLLILREVGLFFLEKYGLKETVSNSLIVDYAMQNSSVFRNEKGITLGFIKHLGELVEDTTEMTNLFNPNATSFKDFLLPTVSAKVAVSVVLGVLRDELESLSITEQKLLFPKTTDPFSGGTVRHKAITGANSNAPKQFTSPNKAMNVAASAFLLECQRSKPKQP